MNIPTSLFGTGRRSQPHLGAHVGQNKLAKGHVFRPWAKVLDTKVEILQQMHHGKLHLVGNHKSARTSMAPNSKMHAALVGGSEVTRRHELWVMPHFGKSEAVETLGIRIESLVLE